MNGYKTALPSPWPGPCAALFRLPTRRALAALALLAALTLGPAPCQAHAVYVFAWTEADRICSESYFSKTNKVRGGRVEVYKPDGTLLASGASDEAGRLCFARPQSSGDLLFVVHAGQGHRGEFLLPAEPALESAPAPAPLPAMDQDMAPLPAPAQAPASPPAYAAGDLEALIRASVREEVRRELEPLRRAFVEKGTDGGPSWREVLGGLGWIAGLAGFGAWYAARRRGQ